MTKETYHFLQALNGFDKRKRIQLLSTTNLWLLTPVILYTLAAMGVAIYIQRYMQVLLLGGIAILAVILLTIYFNYLLTHCNAQVPRRFFPRFKIRGNITLFLLSFLQQKQLRQFLILKTIGFFILYKFVTIDDAVFDYRMLWLFFSICLIGHSVFVFRNFHFLEDELSFYRNLPLSNIKIWLSLFVFYMICFLPEWWALRALGITYHDTAAYLAMVLGGPAILLFFHVLLYANDVNMENFWALTAGVSVLFFFMSMAQQKWLVPVVAIFGTWLIFSVSFRNYEKRAETEKPE
ncbi:MAG: hypothetical protein QM727_10995 [Niabella sp.]